MGDPTYLEMVRDYSGSNGNYKLSTSFASGVQAKLDAELGFSGLRRPRRYRGMSLQIDELQTG